MHGQRDHAHLVRGAEVHAVDLAMGRHRGEVNRARQEHDRQRALAESAHERAQAADPAGAAGGSEQGEAKRLVRRVAHGRERHAVPRRPGDQIHRADRFELPDERARIGERLGGRDGAVQEDATVLDPAEVDAHRPRIDADRSHGLVRRSGFRRSTARARARRWTRRRARGRSARTGWPRRPCESSS